jgi:hypothetical protein
VQATTQLRRFGRPSERRKFARDLDRAPHRPKSGRGTTPNATNLRTLNAVGKCSRPPRLFAHSWTRTTQQRLAPQTQRGSQVPPARPHLPSRSEVPGFGIQGPETDFRQPARHRAESGGAASKDDRLAYREGSSHSDVFERSSFEFGDYPHAMIRIADNLNLSETTRKTHSSTPLPSVI